MIHKEPGGEFVCECDNCGHEQFGGVQDDFRAFVEQLKADYWQIRKDGEEWQHFCPECRS